MLFNSYPFLLVFLPVVLAGFALAGRRGGEAGCAWMVASSLIFYALSGAADGPRFTVLLLVSVAVNFAVGQRLASGGGIWLLRGGVVANLLALGYFKYAGFLGAALFGLPEGAWHVALPVGISFFTFTQIAYLVDAEAGRAGRSSLLHYLLFVTWFPHLVAGPLLHHGRTMPQFRAAGFRLDEAGVAVGTSVFLVGLFKKVVLADGIAPLADTAFAPGAAPGLGAAGAWAGTLAYSLQIYFDFSGYSDMAIGLSRMFGVLLPANFDSPYRATSIVAFWRRWHMSLSAFLRDYVYVPLGGNRRRHCFNLMATMLLAGLWHGAGWGFVAWGAWHGALLAGNHLWRQAGGPAVPRPLGWAATMLAVVLGWVLFRAPDLAAAGAVYRAMAGLDGTGVMPGGRDALLMLAMAGIVLLLPNTRQWMHGEALVVQREAAERVWLRWRPGLWWAMACFALLALSLLRMAEVSPFLYYQF